MATTTLGNKAVGSIIQLKENGKLVSFYVAKHNYENCLLYTSISHQAGR